MHQRPSAIGAGVSALLAGKSPFRAGICSQRHRTGTDVIFSAARKLTREHRFDELPQCDQHHRRPGKEEPDSLPLADRLVEDHG